MKVYFRSLKKLLKRKALLVIVFASTQLLPVLVFGQNPGDNPDAQPQAVPLDSRSSLLLITVGVFLAITVIQKRMTNQQTNVLVKK